MLLHLPEQASVSLDGTQTGPRLLPRSAKPRLGVRLGWGTGLAVAAVNARH